MAFADTPSLAANARVHALAALLEGTTALRTLVPAYASLLVEFDPLAVDPATVEALVRGALARLPADAPRPLGRRRHIPVVYGGEAGPDLEEVAQRVGLSVAEVVARHAGAEQTVYMLGFAPGYPYLGDLPPELALPRRSTPRERVPSGSVAIAGRQTGIYTSPSPGGWHLIGRTPVLLFDVQRDPPAYLAPGDGVRFVPIPAAGWERFGGAPTDW